MKKRGMRRLYHGLHKTARKRSNRFGDLFTGDHSTEIPGWRNCTTIQPLEKDDEVSPKEEAA